MPIVTITECAAPIQIQQLKMRAVQLIAFDSHKNPFIPPPAEALLRSLSSPQLHVIAVAGKYRTGKSYILNRVLLGRSEGFSVGHTINACTKGLWVWPQLVRLDGKDCLIIDTEGLGSLEEGESTDLKIFLLALLFSSQLIYNSVGNIDEQALQSLSLVIQLAGVLQRQDRFDSQQLVNTFPAFLWLLRDFSLRLQNEKGGNITPTEYLQLALKHQNRSSQAVQRKNQIRKQLRTFFHERDCYALVRPTEQERDLQNLSTVDDSKLRPQFVSQVEGLRRKLGMSVKPKRIRGRTLSTEGFIELCHYYTRALVDGKLPTISSHWDNLCLSETHRIFQKYQLLHLNALQAQNTPEEVLSVHKAIVKEGTEAIDKSFLGKLEKQLFRERFERKLQEQMKMIKERANNRKTQQIRLMLQQMEGGEEDPLERFDKVVTKMAQMSESSTKDDGLYCELYLFLCEFARNLLEQSVSAQNEQQQRLNVRLSLLEQQASHLRQQLQSQRKSHQSELSEARAKALESQRRQNSQKEEQSLAQILQLQSTINTFSLENTSLQTIISQKQSQLITLQAAQIQLTNKVNSMQEQISSLQKELLQREAMLNLEMIRSRKVAREKDIIKHRYEQNLEEALEMRSVIDELEKQVAQLQNNHCSERKDEKILRNELLLSRQQNRLLQRLVKQQKYTIETIMQIPQNMWHQAQRKNIETSKKESKQKEKEEKEKGQKVNLEIEDKVRNTQE